DYVAGLDAGLVGGGAGLDLGDDDAAAVDFLGLGFGGRQLFHVNAEEAASDFPLGQEEVGDALGGVGGDGEADALVASRLGGDHGVDADDAAELIEEGPAGVAGKDGGVGLDQLHGVVDVAVAGGDEAALGADDAVRHGVPEAERAAH